MNTPEMDKKYDIQCCSCQAQCWTKPSMAHMMGLFQGGHASCPGCKTFLNIIYDPDTDSMKTRPFSERVAELKKELEEKDKKKSIICPRIKEIDYRCENPTCQDLPHGMACDKVGEEEEYLPRDEFLKKRGELNCK